VSSIAGLTIGIAWVHLSCVSSRVDLNDMALLFYKHGMTLYLLFAI
jgi:hypothetical protein